jgi:hypothetical protein
MVESLAERASEGNPRIEILESTTIAAMPGGVAVAGLAFVLCCLAFAPIPLSP